MSLAITYEVATYLIDKVRSTSGETAARDAEDTLYRKGNAGGRSMSAAAPRAGTQSAAAGGNPDPDWEPDDEVHEKTKRLLNKTDRYKEQLLERPGAAKDATSLRAAKLEQAGQQIPKALEKGVNFDHGEKVESAMRGLTRLSIDGSITTLDKFSKLVKDESDWFFALESTQGESL